MKIIEQGAKEGWWVGKKATCSRCHCIIQFELGDDVKENRDTVGTKIFFNCPECLRREGVEYQGILWFKRC